MAEDLAPEIELATNGFKDAAATAQLTAEQTQFGLEMIKNTSSDIMDLIIDGLKEGWITVENFFEAVGKTGAETAEEVSGTLNETLDQKLTTEVVENMKKAGSVGEALEEGIKTLGTADAEAANEVAAKATTALESGSKEADLVDEAKKPSRLEKIKVWAKENPGKALLVGAGTGVALWLALDPNHSLVDLIELPAQAAQKLGAFVKGLYEALKKLTLGFFDSLKNIFIIVGSVVGVGLIIGLAIWLAKKFKK